MKAKEIRELSDKDLISKLKEERENYTKMRFAHAVSPVESTARITNARKVIARLLTEKRARTAKANNS